MREGREELAGEGKIEKIFLALGDDLALCLQFG